MGGVIRALALACDRDLTTEGATRKITYKAYPGHGGADCRCGD